jgi:hypothetical protein
MHPIDGASGERLGSPTRGRETIHAAIQNAARGSRAAADRHASGIHPGRRGRLPASPGSAADSRGIGTCAAAISGGLTSLSQSTGNVGTIGSGDRIRTYDQALPTVRRAHKRVDLSVWASVSCSVLGLALGTLGVSYRVARSQIGGGSASIGSSETAPFSTALLRIKRV